MFGLNRYVLPGILSVILLVISGVLHLHNSQQEKVVSLAHHLEKSWYTERVEYWSDIINESPESGVSLLAEVGQLLVFSEAHFLAHAFGDALYQYYGPEGIEYCSTDFGYGCFHQLISMAITDHGTAVVHALSENCIKKVHAPTCLHGIGHGVLRHLGYRVEDIRNALQVCESIQTSGHSTCAEGVFMEFGLQSLEEQSESQTRSFTYTERFTPCDQFTNTKYYDACIYQLPTWWTFAITQYVELTSKFIQEGLYCRELFGAVRDTCFLGIGSNIAFKTNHDRNKTLEICTQVGRTDREQNLCLIGSIRRDVLWTHANTHTLCSALKLEETEWHRFCLTYGDINMPRTSPPR